MLYQVLWEMTQGALGKAPAAVTETPGTSGAAKETAPLPAEEEAEEEDPEELREMQSRLEALRS